MNSKFEIDSLAEEQINQVQSLLFSHILKVMGDQYAIYLLNNKDQFIYINESVCKTWFGRPINQVLGSTWLEVAHHTDESKILMQQNIDYCKRGLNPDTTFLEFETKGEIKIIQIDQGPILTELGEFQYIVGLAKDMTTDIETKQLLTDLYVDLDLANSTKEKMFSIIAHDLRGPIGSIKSMFDSFSIQEISSNPKILSIIEKSASTSFGLLEELLAWTMEQSSTIGLSKKVFPIDEIFSGIFDLYQTAAEQKKIAVTVPNHPIDIHIYADIRSLQTVVRNLVGNAMKFTPSGGSVTVHWQASGENVKIMVADTGVGMAPEKVNTLFSRQGRLQSTMGTAGEAGTGLGLELCKEFVTRNGGTMGVESSQGEGTCFWFHLPIVTGQ